jgi:hypothetical protein
MSEEPKPKDTRTTEEKRRDARASYYRDWMAELSVAIIVALDTGRDTIMLVDMSEQTFRCLARVVSQQFSFPKVVYHHRIRSFKV